MILISCVLLGEPMCLVAACTHICHATPSGPVCSCPPALHLQRDGLTCAPNHVCEDWGVCSQTCLPQKNRYKCTCDEGYRLADDGFTCKSTCKLSTESESTRESVRACEVLSPWFDACCSWRDAAACVQQPARGARHRAADAGGARADLVTQEHHLAGLAARGVRRRAPLLDGRRGRQHLFRAHCRQR